MATVAAVGLALVSSRDFALSKEEATARSGRGGNSAGNSSHGSSGGRVYTATMPRFKGSSAVRSHPGARPAGYQAGQARGLGQYQTRQSLNRNSRMVQPGSTNVGNGNRLRNWSHNNQTGKSKLDPQAAIRLRNWRGQRDTLSQALLKNREHHHRHHDHGWWKTHCPAIILIDSGYWAWLDGWWYPAWGYDPYYSDYEYDGPVYSYNGLPPDQVVADVQGALQELGYYPYQVDGVLGELTRAALARYQQDHGLSPTGIIDPPTLQSLGLTP